MTDQNQNKPEVGAEKSGHHHRSRNRHHHKRHHRPNAEAAGAEKALQTPETAVEKKEHTSDAQSEKREKSDRSQKNEKKGDQNRRNDQKHRDRGGKSGNRGNNRPHRSESRPYDPYEAPSREEIALSELRAQIVLKSADGSVPTAYTPATKPVEPAAEPTPVEDLPALDEQPEATVEEAPEVPRVEVVGVRFRSAGKTYYFDPHGLTVQKGDFAIVETTRGPEFGEISLANSMVKETETVAPLRPLLRVATPADVAQNEQNREKEKQALVVCQEKIEKHKLEMKLIDVQYAFDGSKLLFYFAAEGRVDFRELVKDLASVFRTRIELRQIGIRDEAKMLGGIGACGRALCCSTFLPDFAQVSIKMAKDQNLSLNSSKISGVCGRLMCCLRYEAETYAEEIKKTPSNDTLVRTEDGLGVVIGSNPLAGTIRVLLKDQPDTAPKQYHRDSVTVLGKEKRGGDSKKKSDEE